MQYMEIDLEYHEDKCVHDIELVYFLFSVIHEDGHVYNLDLVML